MTNTKTQIDLRNRPLYVGTAVALIILLGLTVWGFVSNHSIADTTLQAGDLKISKMELMADGVDSSEVVVTVTQKEDNLPLSDVWVGLNINDDKLATPELSSFGWYSPEPERSFYQTNNQGQVKFSVRSKIAGDITYSIYAADPGQKNSGKYLSLGRDFTLHFE
ncbi:Ig-like domain-containing protein [Patescibacteria group bacterium]|nr:Ig-like domain-containing protein [Patescibacteria group bacterium]